MNIVAEFADRYVWEYDGTPIELYNDEPVDGIGVAEGGEIFFFAELDEPGNMLRIETYGGSGDICCRLKGCNLNSISLREAAPEERWRPQQNPLTSTAEKTAQTT